MNLLHDLLNNLLYTSLAVAAISRSTALAGDGTVMTKPSKYSVPETIGRIDGGEAKKVELAMRPTELLISGNPKGGTALMMAKPTAAIDPPMKALA